MECFYRVYFNDGSVKTFVPKELVDKKLQDFDRFSIKGNMDYYVESVAQTIGLTKYDAKKITVVDKAKTTDKEIEYSLINGNPYFEDVFDNLERREVGAYGKPATVRLVISTESESYQDMIKWLFKELKENSDNFFNNLYSKFPNKFSELLERYVSSINTYIEGEEDYHYQYELETAIRATLSVYPVYRGLATRRYNSEKYIDYNRGVNDKQEERKVYEPTAEEIEEKNKKLEEYYASMDDSAYNIDRYNKEHDEFLEPEEYGPMAGSGRLL